MRSLSIICVFTLLASGAVGQEFPWYGGRTDNVAGFNLLDPNGVPTSTIDDVTNVIARYKVTGVAGDPNSVLSAGTDGTHSDWSSYFSGGVFYVNFPDAVCDTNGVEVTLILDPNGEAFQRSVLVKSIYHTLAHAMLFSTGPIPEANLASASALATAQADLDTITGSNGVNIADDAITSGKFDESTAFPNQDADGSWLTEAGGDGDHLTEAGGSGDQFTDINNVAVTANVALYEAEIATVVDQRTFTLATGPNVDNIHVGAWVIIMDDSASDLVWSEHEVVGYTGSSKTIRIKGTPRFTVGTDDSIRFMPSVPSVLEIIKNTAG